MTSAGAPGATLDAHVHLWRYHADEYRWIEPTQTVLCRNHLPETTLPVLAASGIAGCIAVQARQSLAETQALLAHAARHPAIAGVVGWVPLVDPALPALLARLRDPRLVGVRHVVQDEPDPGFLARPAIRQGLASVAAAGLSYDLLLRPHQLEAGLAVVDAFPQLRCILDHGGKPACTPRTAPAVRQAWARQLRAYAARSNTWCKLSGLALEAGPGWTAEGLRPWVEELLAAFGPRRVLYGSDHPVCLLATSYAGWLGAVRGWIAGLSPDEQAAILGGAARDAYRLATPARRLDALEAR